MASLARRLARRAYYSIFPTPIFASKASTSISDGGAYVRFCELAASSDEVFANFRQNATYQVILEHMSQEHGRELVSIADDRFPGYDWDSFRENDRVGGAETCDLGPAGVLSPNTARYVKVLSDLEVLFGSINDMQIVEIGGGYGGQARVVSARFSPASYTILDLPGPAALANRYLSHYQTPAKASSVIEPAKPDLVISNYALSEIRRSVQEKYYEAYIRNSARGFMFWNSKVWGSPSLIRDAESPISEEEFAERVNGRIIREAPFITSTDRKSKVALIIWGD